jgi:hypothetical protein
MNESAAVTQETTLTNVTIYTSGEMMGGIHRVDCRDIKIITGVRYAQYPDATRIEFLPKGKRLRLMIHLHPGSWCRIVDTKLAIEPDPWLVPAGDGNRHSRYLSCDPRYKTDFEDQLVAAGTPAVFSYGAGEREGELAERYRNMDTRVSGRYIPPSARTGSASNAAALKDEAVSQ